MYSVGYGFRRTWIIQPKPTMPNHDNPVFSNRLTRILHTTRSERIQTNKLPSENSVRKHRFFSSEIEKKEKWMNELYLKFVTQTRLLDKLIGQTRL